MRYELDGNGYVNKVFFGCHSGTCTEYTGDVPTGYESLEKWSEEANIRAYKIVDGQLVYDSAKDTELQNLYKNQSYTYSTIEQKIGTWVDGKPIYRKYVSGTTFASGGAAVVLVSNVSDLVNHSIVIQRKDSTQWHPPTSSMVSNDSAHACPLFVSDGSIHLYVYNGNFANQPFKGYIEYTKTTD